MTVHTGPCDLWTSQAEVIDGWTLPAGTSGDRLAKAMAGASDVMFQLGGQRWPGLCSRWVRPEDCGDALCWLPLPEGGQVARRSHPRGRRCGGGDALDVGVYPLTFVWEILLDGVGLATGFTRIHRERYIVRTDGGSWPCLLNNDEEPAKLAVNVQFGSAPPDLGRLAATALARELLLAWDDSDTCRLDRRVRSITRENVSMDFAIPGLAESLAGGQTGIPEVDLFVHAHNPHHLRRAARFVNL